MNIGNLERATRLARDVRDLERARDGGKFGVTIGGQYQDDEMLAAVDAAIRGELGRRIACRHEELTALGVEVA